MRSPANRVRCSLDEPKPQADDVYTFEFPLPKPGSVPFTIPRDDLHRGLTWSVVVRTICQRTAQERSTRTEIDARLAAR